MHPSSIARNSPSLNPGNIASSSALALGSAITSSSRPSKRSMMPMILMVAFFASITGDDAALESAFDPSAPTDGDGRRPPPAPPCLSLTRKILSTAS